MSFAPRRRATRGLAALLALVVVMIPLTVTGAALAQTSTITKQDCAQGTIRDKSGSPISKARCEALVGKQVQLASTGFTVWPFALAGVVLILGAGFVGLRGRGAPRTV